MLRPAVALLAFLLPAVLLAGCGDKAGPAAAPTTDQLMLRGVVVTQAIVPISGASVSVNPGGFNATTGADGLWSVGPVEPGTYQLLVRAPGYADLSGPVSANGTVVKSVLVATSTNVPYIEVLKFDGYHDCTFDFYVDGVGSQTVPCGIADCVTGQDLTNDIWLFPFRVDSPGLAGLLAEMVWDGQPTAPANQMGMHLRSSATAGGCVDAGGGVDVQYASMRGPSPLQMWVHQGIENPGAEEGAAFQVPQNETKDYQIMTVGRADYDSQADVHLMLQSKQQVFVTLFYHKMGDPSYSVLKA